MVALRVLARKPDVLVHVEGDDVLEGERAALHHGNERLVRWERARVRGEAEDELARGRGAELGDAASDVRGEVGADGGGIVADDEACGWGQRGGATHALGREAWERVAGCGLL